MPLGRTDKETRGQGGNCKENRHKIKIVMVRVMIEKEERSENTVLAMMEADTSDTALVNNNFKDVDAQT